MRSRVPIPRSQAIRPGHRSPPGSTRWSAGSLALLLVLGLGSVAHARPDPAQLDRLPPAASRPVDFAKDIQPILEASCVKCHGRGKSKGGFRLDTRESLLQPADSGPAAVPGDSRSSLLIHLVAGLDPGNVMPNKGTRLTAEQVGLLRAWIDQQLPWQAGTTFAREAHRNFQPRQPALPGAPDAASHPVDRLVTAYFQRHQIQPPEPVDDRRFARRVHLDVVGLLPSPDELEAFLRDPAPDRRERLVRRLLADRSRYAQHWLTFWNDLLRNDYRGTGYIDGGREQVSKWLFTALRDNVPYDRFVRELVNPGDGPARGFTKGIVWRGVVNSSQTPQMQAAQNIAQVFLGVNLKCASCHDSFIDDWQLTDAYGMAGVYADEKLELVQCDKPLGRHAPVKFVFPELGGIDDNAPKAQRVARLAELLTSRENGRLPRTLVNRLWARLMGRGLVEPLDVMQNPAWDTDLLDWLAEDFVAHNYDIQHTLELILTSQAYRLPAIDLPDSPRPDFVFHGPAIRRLGAEQFRDAVGQLTGVWAEKPEGGLDSLLVQPGSDSELPASATWIWSDPHAAQGVSPQTVRFRRTIDLPEAVTEAVAVVNVDNSHRLWVNGREARGRNDLPWSETSVLDLRPFLRLGANTFAVEAVNGGDGPNPAGLLFYARLRTADGKRFDFASDASWLATTNRVEGWNKPEIDPGSASTGWSASQVLGPADLAPWSIGAQFVAAASGRPVYGNVRAALVPADPLALALGRPNREQVTSVRSMTATTLQVLELTNGGTLARVLKTGAARLAAESNPGARVVERLFLQGLGRAPTPAESELAVALVGTQPRTEGLEDLLWSVAMLPEFQLIF